MAKRSAARKTTRAYSIPNATRRVRGVVKHALPRRLATTSKKGSLTLYQDNRTWHPERTFRPALSLSRRGAVRTKPLVLAKPTPYQLPRLTEPLRFPDPKRTLLCIRRAQRKRVIHAKGVAGSKRLRKPRRTQWSEVSC